ncbi:hypothetical protein RMN56_22600 [Micromonospora halotolerans]|uniref:Isoprenylcysteine carboxyl methyltransferase n=1 Tax=Micromonospora halotolerans TaxID=709879 RepID=A0ABY9ZRJ6_9ACTN|nr:hypothetical protein [Micromonospora halotolerans]WNM37922.1 hypothetical protein RMN56_22600 [Micromonospora halotolerans]
MTRLATAGVAAHVFFELGAGVGMPTASILGPVPAAGLWALGAATVWRAAGSYPPSSDAAFAACNGIGLAAVIAHLQGWPRERGYLGLPRLRECEGMGPELMTFYNPILYVSGGAAVAGLVWENRSAPRYLPLLALALVPMLIVLQHAEHLRLKDLAQRRPGWWNRRLQQQTDPAIA